MATCQQFVNELSSRLRDDDLDTPKEQWTQDFLVKATNAAFSALCHVLPQAYVIRRTFALVPGTEQQIPDDVHRLVHLDYNVPSNKPIIKANMAVLDKSAPGWRNDPTRGHVIHYMHDLAEERFFEVWPQVGEEESVTVRGTFTKTPKVSENPAELLDGDVYINEEFPFDRSHWEPCMEYALYYCLTRDDETSVNSNRGNNHRRHFFELMNKREETEMFLAAQEDNTE